MVVVVMVPALVTALAVGIFNIDEEVEVPAVVDKAAVVPEVWHKGISGPQLSF